jgi:DNA-3-methyladenine glycosylase
VYKENYRHLPLSFFQRDTLDLVPEILGKVLVRRIHGETLSGRIVEVEAYVGNDPASHAARGMTERNEVMFEEGGFSYVYFTYGMHFCFNIVTERKGFPAALLIRALEPLEGIETMKKLRKLVPTKEGADVIRNLTNGPAKLCQAMQIDRKLNGVKLDGKDFFIADDGFVADKKGIGKSTRIGIKVGTDRKWRFFLKGNEFVSKPQVRMAL